MAINEQTKITVPFANSGLRNYIPQTATDSNLASYEEGFPAITMTDIASGGQPPDGKDFNGIFNVITKILQYAQSGGLYKYDSDYAESVNGYPLGAILRSASGSKIWVNTSAGNATDPDNGGTNWVELTNASALASAISAVEGLVSAEATARANAVSAEATARANAVSALQSSKQNNLTFDSTPTAGSSNPVTSGGIKTAIDNIDALPSQSGHSGQYLRTDGESASWEDVESLPAQTGNAGKVLTTDGTTASWQPVQSRNVGEYVWSALPLTDAGLNLLDGLLLPSGGVYDGFVQKIKSLFVSQNPSLKWLPKEQIVLPTFSANTQDGITISDARGNTTNLQNIFNGTSSMVQIGLWTTYWINIDYAQNRLLSSYTIQADNSGSPEYPSAWVVNGSNDGETWEQIDSQSGITFSLNESKTFTVNPNKTYKQYRIVFSAGVLAENSGELKKISFDAYSAIQGYESGLFFTEEQWKDCVAKYGSCGKFVYSDDGVRLPKVSDIVQGTTDASELGDMIEAGLPNITGTFTASDIVYGRSGTVQPQTIKALLYIVVATAIKTPVEVDIDEIATDLNGKADKDFSNATPSQTFKDSSVSWGIPDYQSEVSIAWNTEIVMPVNALVTANANTIYNEFVRIDIDGVTNGGVGAGGSSGVYVEVARYAKKGSVVKVRGGDSNRKARYYPLMMEVN